MSILSSQSFHGLMTREGKRRQQGEQHLTTVTAKECITLTKKQDRKLHVQCICMAYYYRYCMFRGMSVCLGKMWMCGSANVTVGVSNG